ncbi:MAG: hypothetical protein LBC64_08600 [Fibromonadaceae bacterium]|nr:hypothetical protein [Fibromonadaceae bacterium]
MGKKIKEETLTSFLSHKVKDYAEYREYMKPRNSDHSFATLKFRTPKLSDNKAFQLKQFTF